METSSFLDLTIDTTMSVFARNAQLMRHAGSSIQIEIRYIFLGQHAVALDHLG